MPLTKLVFRPGINKETTSYSNEGGWFDSDKVRFRAGFPEKIGGWLKKSSSAILGSARALHNWSALDNSTIIGIGTHLKYYLLIGQTFFDITPIRSTVTGEATFAATNGSSTITVTDAGHGAVLNDFVTFTSAVSLGGNITADVLNQEYQIVSVPDNNTFTIQARAAGTSIASITTTSGLNPSLVTANSSDTGNGGGSTVAAYQLNVGIDVSVPGVGWGAGTWGRGTWNSDADTAVSTQNLRIWSHDNFCEDLIIYARDGGIYYWDKTNGLGNRARELSDTSTFSNETSVPQIAKQVLVSDQDRHVICFGCDGLGATPTTLRGDGVQDPLLIRFSSQENPVDFFPTATNTAGDLRLGGGSTFVQAVETKQQILVFTNKTLHAMKFIGPPFTFGLQELSKNITIMSPFSAIAVEDAVFWMGVDTFYAYAGGQTVQLPCTVKDKVFLDFNLEERDKVHVGLNSEFSEILWFYPSSAGREIDKYVAYNYLEKIWYYGTLARQAWLDRGIRGLPQATGGQYLYNHETGFDDDGSAMTSFIESSAIDIGDGDKFVFLKQVIPDVSFNGSTSVNPDIAFTMKVRNNPGANFHESTSNTTTRTATSPVEQFTEKLNYRLRGRSFALRIDSTSLGTKYKLGTPRIDIREDGRR